MMTGIGKDLIEIQKTRFELEEKLPLEVKKLSLEVQKLGEEVKKIQSLIARPTADEIAKFTVGETVQKLPDVPEKPFFRR